MIFFSWPRVSLGFIVKKSLASRSYTRHDTECLNHASSPVQKAGQVQCSQSVLVAPVPKVWYQSCRSSLCIFQLGNIYLQMRTPDAVRGMCGLINEVNKRRNTSWSIYSEKCAVSDRSSYLPFSLCIQCVV